MEKLSLFKNCDVVIYNGDDEFISNCVAKSMLSAREIAWSRKDMERPLFISKVEKKEDCIVIWRWIIPLYCLLLTMLPLRTRLTAWLPVFI